ncbi:MAG: NADP-dependent isocitrate dehydrogenase [Sandaracinaceae bacterium]
MDSTPIAIARGDGIGPEIMDATLTILEAGGARFDAREITVGEQVYRHGHSSGIDDAAWDVIRECRVLLKAPITTPQGGGVKSLNVTLRKSLGLFANIRPVEAYAPFVPTFHPLMDMVIVRENEEDLYAGIEHVQTDEVAQALKLISRPGSERIIRYAFEYARLNGRRRVTAMVKDNILKLTDGLFAKVFEEVAAEYPQVEGEQLIVDIGAARLANTPERFGVVVTPNLYGDILSDVVAETSGSVGMCGSANVGESAAMFEAIHGSAPDIAGRGIANPSGLLQGALLMLRHIGQGETAARIQNAWLCTIEAGIHTPDIHNRHSTERVGTQEFTEAVIGHLGERPRKLRPAPASSAPLSDCVVPLSPRPRRAKAMVGVDVFLDWAEGDRNPEALAEKLAPASGDALDLVVITNRGVKVWPRGMEETFRSDHWRCRFHSRSGGPVTHAQLAALVTRVGELGLDWIKTETLCTFDGEPGYSLGQGE